MNISGILVQTLPENLETVIAQIKNSDCCEYHQHDEKGRIIVTIEGEGVEEELEKLRELKAFDKVVAADMMYAYSEDELDAQREKLEASEEMPDWLNDPNVRAEDIRYNGDLKGRF